MQEINNTENTPRPKNFGVLYFLITIVIILIIGVGVYLIPKSGEDSLISKNLISDNEYKSNSLNIQFTLPSGWKEIKSDELAYIPEFFSNPKLILKNEQKSCIVVAYTPFRQIGITQTGWADDINDGPERWFAPTANIPSYVNIYQAPVRKGVLMVTDFKNPRQKINGEFVEYGSFYLYDKNGQTVNDECEQDIKTIVTTNKSYYEKYTINNSSEGILRFNGADLLFIPKNTNDNFLIITMPSRVSIQDNIIISGKKIYFVVNDESSATIKYYDISTNKIDTVLGTVGKHGYISSMSLISDNIIYIAGSKEFGYCLDLPKDKCLTASLYKYNFNEDKVELLAENIKGSNILGADESGSIYFSLSWGDAGAWFATIYKYKNGNIEQYKNYSDTSQIEEYEKFIISLNKVSGYQSIILKNGELFPGPEISRYSKNNYLFIN